MFLKKTFSARTSLTFRLAFSLAAVVAVCLLVTFSLVYAVTASAARHRVDAKLRHEAAEITALLSLHGISAIQDSLTRTAHAEGTDVMLYRILDTRGRTVAESDTASWQELTVDTEVLTTLKDGAPVFESVPGDSIENESRVIYARLSSDLTLQVALRVEQEFRPIHNLQRVFLTVGGMGLCCSVLLGWFIARRALGPMRTMTGIAMAIAEGNFDARVPSKHRDAEFERLARAFNVMLDRIQSFVRELREMNDSLAHDLRTMLARLRLAADRLLSTRPMTEEQESLAASILEESNGLLDMLNTIMDLSEMNTGIARPRFAEVDVAALLSELCEFFEATAREKQIALKFKSTDATVVSGDSSRLRRAFANILDNAVKYTNGGGGIEVDVRSNGTLVTISVADTGIGIPVSASPFVFDRFYRADESRSSQGHGLGLTLAEAIVRLHKGTIEFQSTEGVGTTFTICLPRLVTV